jgi:hypothetical protein
MMPVGTVTRLAAAGRLELRRTAYARREQRVSTPSAQPARVATSLMHAKEIGRLHAICGFVPSGTWSDDEPVGGGRCSKCVRHLRRAGFESSILNRVVAIAQESR